MRQIKTVFVIALLAAILSAGCDKKNQDFPAPLDVTIPPKVSSIAITLVSSPPPYDYDVEWTISDISDVQFFRVYSSFDGQNFALVQDTIPPTQTLAQFTASLPVLSFGVSTVSYDNVEAAMVTELSP